MDEIQVRPDPAKYRRWLLTTGPILVLGGIGLGFRIAHDLQQGGTPWLWWSLFGVLALFIGANLLAFRNERLFAGDGFIGETSWIGRRKRIRRDDVKFVVRIGVRQRYGSAPKLVVVNKNDERVIVLDDRMWNDQALDAVWDRLGHHPEGSFEDVVSPGTFADRYPKASSWDPVGGWWAPTTPPSAGPSRRDAVGTEKPSND